MSVDETALNNLLGKMVGDLGVAMGAALIIVGDKLGLYKALAGAGPLTSTDLAAKTATDERYVREWLAQQAAAGYLHYDAASARYLMTPEQAMVFAAEGGPAFMLGAFEIVGSMHARRSQNHRGV